MSQRKLLLPPFHGERMQGYEQTMSEIAEREIESWPTGTPYQLRPRMQAITLEIILRDRLRRPRRRADGASCALRCASSSTSPPIPRILLPLLLLGPSRVAPSSRPSAAGSTASTS